MTRPLQPLLAHRVEEEAGKGDVVLDDQQHGVAGLDGVAVVLRLVGQQRRLGGVLDQHLRPVIEGPVLRPSPAAPSISVSARLRGPARHARRRVRHGQIEREARASARAAHQPDLAAEQLRQLAADGKAQPGAAVLAAGAAVRLLERLEDDLLLFAGDADAGVGDVKATASARG